DGSPATLLPISRDSLIRGLVVNASFLDSGRQLIGASNREVCSFDFSKTDILILNTSGGMFTKQCTIAPANVPAGTMFVNTTATIDPQDTIKETSETNNISEAKEISFQGQDATQVVNVTVKIEPIVSLSGIKILFQDASNGLLQAVCFGGACSVSLPAGEYQVLTNTTFFICSEPDCPLKFQVVDRAVDLELKVKSITPQSNYCADSDVGEDNPYFVKGAVRAYSKNSFVFSGMTDSCVTRSRVVYVREYSCSGTTYNYNDYQCPNGCYDGACLQNCATLFGSADLQCKPLVEIEAIRQQCSNKEVIYDKLRVGQYCSKTGGDYCVQCKPECENDADCNTRQCPIAGEEPYCSSQKCGCRKTLPDLTITAAFTCPKNLYNTSEPISGCSITIKNVGTAGTTVAPKINLYDVSGAIWKQLSQTPHSGVLLPNAVAPIEFGSFSFTVSGVYKLQVCVDYKNNEIAERNEDNNCSSVLPIEVKALPTVSLPDLLTATVLVCPKNLYNTGDSISGCSIAIKNQGNVDTTIKPTTVLRHKTANTAWKALNTITSPAILLKGLSKTIIFNNFKFDATSTYILQACVDPDPSQIAESNENNNCSSEVSIEVKDLPLTACSPSGWWCGTYSDWKGQCSGSGTYQILTDENICKKTGENYCVTCGVKTVFRAELANDKTIAIEGAQILLSPVDSSSDF
ncbi:MAG: CARDB domain-containing protein, partial [Nanoarchaeota archaeon]